MKTQILIVTYIRDFAWLTWALRSIAKFASGFSGVTVALPGDTPADEWGKVRNEYHGETPLTLFGFTDWPGKGFLCHADQICRADEICEDADFILHMDADCIFTEPVVPEDYFVDGKPVLIYADYDWIVQRFKNPNHYEWKKAVEKALGGTNFAETMRRHPAVHYRAVYGALRTMIMAHAGLRAEDYIRAQRNTFPQTFAEFPTLGEVAWRLYRDKYHWVNQATDPWPKDKLMQCWSHGPMDKPNNVWWGGQLKTVVPLEYFKEHLL